MKRIERKERQLIRITFSSFSWQYWQVFWAMNDNAGLLLLKWKIPSLQRTAYL
jgi:hypothetical protein